MVKAVRQLGTARMRAGSVRLLESQPLYIVICCKPHEAYNSN